MKIGIYFDKAGGERGGPFVRAKLLEKHIPFVKTFNDIDEAENFDLLDFQWRVPVSLNKYEHISTFHGILPLKYCSNLHAKAAMFLRTQEQKAILKSALNVIAVSHEAKRQLLKLGINKNKINVVYAGLEMDRYKDADKDAEILFLNSLEKYENLQVILKALKYGDYCGFDYETNSPPFIVNAYGHGRMQNAYEKMIIKYDLPVNICEEVNNEQIINKLAFSKALIQPALQETFGLPICEAMASRSIAIVSDIRSHRENFKNVLFFNPYDYKTLIRLIEEVLQGEHDDIIKKAYYEVRKKYNAERFVDETRKIYKKCYLQSNS
jgi:glycosyltransferase involved in cell wall biosynthesis